MGKGEDCKATARERRADEFRPAVADTLRGRWTETLGVIEEAWLIIAGESLEEIERWWSRPQAKKVLGRVYKGEAHFSGI